VRRSLPLLLLVLGALLALGACSAPATTGVRTMNAADAVAQIDERAVIDVRTPAETQAGMIAGARNIDIGAPDFRDRIAELDRDGSYLVYCRSGNRSAQAAAIMEELGFTDVVDAGGLDALVAAGAPTAP
jgi:rhodanese-related sulfurtransferase